MARSKILDMLTSKKQCPGFRWDGVNLLPSGWYSVMGFAFRIMFIETTKT